MRRIGLGVSIGALMIACAAQASATTPPPISMSVDANGVDLISGYYVAATPDAAIGVAGSGGLVRTPAVLFGDILARADDNFHGYISVAGATYTVSIGNSSATFNSSGVSLQGNGSSLRISANTYVYTTSDGTTYTFTNSLLDNTSRSFAVAMLSSISKPDGEIDSLNYNAYAGYVSGANVTLWRLDSIRNNLGYGINYSYASNNPASSFYTVTQVTSINNALPGSYSTTFSQTSNSTTVTDSLGRTTTYTAPDAYGTETITYPNGQTVKIGLDPFGRVVSYSNGVGTWQYAYSASGSNQTTTITDPLGHTRTAKFTTILDVITSDTDALGNTTSYAYDSYGRLTQKTAPDGSAVQYSYDGRGNIVRTTAVAAPGSGLANIVTSANYDPTCYSNFTLKCNKPNSTTDANGNTTTYNYTDDSHGGLLYQETLPAGANGINAQINFNYQQLYAYYSASGGPIAQGPSPVYRLIQTTVCANSTASCSGTSDQTVSSIAYDQSGAATNVLPLSTTISAGDGSVSASSYYSYYPTGDVAQRSGPLPGQSWLYLYDADRELTGVIGPAATSGAPNRATRLTYDALGDVTLVEQGTTPGQSAAAFQNFSTIIQDQRVFDGLGRKVKDSVVDPNSGTYNQTEYAYDAANNLQCSKVAISNIDPVTSAPTSPCTPLSWINGPDRVSYRIYDADNRLTQLIQGYGAPISRTAVTKTYTATGQVATVADADNHLTTFKYDGFGRRVEIDYPSVSTAGKSDSGNRELFSYDANSNVVGKTLRSGDTLALTYDGMNNLTAVDSGSSTGFAPIHNKYTYDALGHMKTASNAWTYTFTYDALGRKLSEAQPGANVSYQYDAAGNKTAMTWINGFYATYAYDAYNEVTGISENGTYNLASFSYDNLGRRTSVAHPNNTSTGYSYDGGSRLWVEQLNLPSGSEEITLQHNPANQITLRSSTNNSYQFANVWNPTRGYTSDGLNRLTSSDGAALSYDGRGNLSVDQNGTSYGYDPLNDLVSTSNSIGLGYDPLGRLQVIGVNGVNTQFIYDGDQIIAELDGSFHPLRWYVDGPGEDQPMVWYEGWNTGDRRFLLADERGSIVSVTNGSGQVMATNTYDEYGLPGSGNLGRFQYTGQAWIPELGLYHYKARAYSPSLGRFMQTDPSGYGDGLNLYAYVHNDPVNEIDPTGLEGDPPTEPCKPDGTDCTVSEVVVTAHRPNWFSVIISTISSLPKFIYISLPEQQSNNVSCNTVLPNGKTVGQMVQSSIANIEGAAGDYDMGGAGEFGAFFATVQGHGPIDFKNIMGPDPTGRLGAAGNFAYGAIASGIGYSQKFAEFGAGVYAATKHKFNLNNPMGEDNSAAQNLAAGYATNGCTK